MESTTAFIAMVFGVIAAVILFRMIDNSDNAGIFYAISTAILILCAFAIGANIAGGNVAIITAAGAVMIGILTASYKQITGEPLIDKKKRK